MRYGGEYFGAANDQVACIPMIETRQAVEHIDDILSVPGIDAVYVGPADLSVTYGLPPALDQAGDPFHERACHDRGRVRATRRGAGHPREQRARQAQRHGAGFRMITVGFDAAPAMAALRADAKAARTAIG